MYKYAEILDALKEAVQEYFGDRMNVIDVRMETENTSVHCVEFYNGTEDVYRHRSNMICLERYALCHKPMEKIVTEILEEAFKVSNETIELGRNAYYKIISAENKNAIEYRYTLAFDCNYRDEPLMLGMFTEKDGVERLVSQDEITHDINEEVLINMALENSAKKFEPILVPGTAAFTMIFTRKDFEDLNVFKTGKRCDMYVLIDATYENGATALFIGDTLEKIAEFIGEDFYVIMPNAGDAVIFPESSSMIKGVNLYEYVNSLLEEEAINRNTLTNEVFKYNCEKEKLEIVTQFFKRLKNVKLMHKVMQSMNNEDAYLTWIYLMPDEPDDEDFECFAEEETEYKELKAMYDRLCRAYGKYGLCDADRETFEFAVRTMPGIKNYKK